MIIKVIAIPWKPLIGGERLSLIFVAQVYKINKCQINSTKRVFPDSFLSSAIVPLPSVVSLELQVMENRRNGGSGYSVVHRSIIIVTLATEQKLITDPPA
jgi:hypothetical protein